MTAIADQSEIVTWSGSTWVVVVFVLFVAGLVWLFREWMNAPYGNEGPSQLDHWDGVMRTHCTVATCTNPVRTHISTGHDYWPFCETHGLPYLTEELKP